MLTQWFNLGSSLGMAIKFFWNFYFVTKVPFVAPKSFFSTYFFMRKNCSNHCFQNSNFYILCYIYVCFFSAKKMQNAEKKKKEEKIPHMGDTNSLDRCGGGWGWLMRGLKLIMWSQGQWEASGKITWEGDKHSRDNTRTDRLCDY